MTDDLIFLPEDEAPLSLPKAFWKVLVVDDEEAVQVITCNAIKDIVIQNKGLAVYSASSFQEARDILSQHEDFALGLIDVVMETPSAGLDLVNYIRHDLNNDMMRLVIRTGQPNQAPEKQVIENYDINDYKEKTELTAQKLFTVIRSSIKQYEQLIQLQEKYQETYRRMTIHPISQLSNRIKLNECLDTDGKKSLLLVNIDGFSMINDSQGFDAGNTLLKQFGELLLTNFSHQMAVFHLEADNFVLLCEEGPLNFCDQSYIESIRKKIQNHVFNIDGINLHLSVSAGLVNNETGNLIQKAELALKEVKTYREGSVKTYSNQLQIVKVIEETLLWKNRLHDAIFDHRIHSFYQPIVDLNNHRIIKYEALVRLEYDGRYYTPNYFLEAARGSGQLFDIFKLMLTNVCEQITQGYGKFSINVDKSDLLEPQLLPFISHTLKHYHIQPGQITLEILENRSLMEHRGIATLLNQLRELGILIAIDDFGAQCSNYSQLTGITFDFIKIDGKFIKDIDTNKNSQIVASTIVDFSKKMNIPVIAEYVHSETINEIVKDMGIEYAQGYFFAEPGPDLKKL